MPPLERPCSVDPPPHYINVVACDNCTGNFQGTIDCCGSPMRPLSGSVYVGSGSLVRIPPVASWHRQAGTSCDELKDLGGWKSRVMVDRYAKFATEHLSVAAARIERGGEKNVVELVRFCHGQKDKGLAVKLTLCLFGRPCRDRTCDQRIKSPLLYQLS